MGGFESCFSACNVPNDLTGTIDFCSPDMGKYINAMNNADELKTSISEKTDIFSLGLVYHFFLAGEFPNAVDLTEKLQRRKDRGKIIQPWMLTSECKLKISDHIVNKQYRSLLSDMLSVDPNARPTAREILSRLESFKS